MHQTFLIGDTSSEFGGQSPGECNVQCCISVNWPSCRNHLKCSKTALSQ